MQSDYGVCWSDWRRQWGRWSSERFRCMHFMLCCWVSLQSSDKANLQCTKHWEIRNHELGRVIVWKNLQGPVYWNGRWLSVISDIVFKTHNCTINRAAERWFEDVDDGYWDKVDFRCTLLMPKLWLSCVYVNGLVLELFPVVVSNCWYIIEWKDTPRMWYWAVSYWTCVWRLVSHEVFGSVEGPARQDMRVNMRDRE